MERSARGSTEVLTSLLKLFSGCKRGVSELTEALLESVCPPSAGAVTVIVMSGAETWPGLPPGGAARLAKVQVTVVAGGAEHVQLLPLASLPLVALTSVTPVGRVSLTVTLEAAFGPAFLTLSV